MMLKPVNILCIDGGGIKGVVPSIILEAIEDLCAPHAIHELFDLIGGVSTGGIIALGLARGVPLRELEKMYRDIGRDVFGSQSAIRRLLKGNAADNTAIRELLLEYLGDLPMLDAPGQLARCFVVATQQTERLEVRLVRTYRHPNKGRDQNEGWRQWEAGMATSSAPTVFPPFVREIRGDENASGVATSSAAATVVSVERSSRSKRALEVDGMRSPLHEPSPLADAPLPLSTGAAAPRLPPKLGRAISVPSPARAHCASSSCSASHAPIAASASSADAPADRAAHCGVGGSEVQGWDVAGGGGHG